MLFTVTVPFATEADEAIARVERRLPDTGFFVTGRTAEWVALGKVRGTEVLVEAMEGADVDDAWVTLTSYGLSPEGLGSRWENVAGVGC